MSNTPPRCYQASDGLKPKLQQSPAHSKRWSAPFRASGTNPTRFNRDTAFPVNRTADGLEPAILSS
jgi:hypothetical protein